MEANDDLREDDAGSQVGLTRRQVLKRGNVGGLLWTVPTLQVISDAAHADTASGVTPPPPPQRLCTSSYGLIVLNRKGRIVEVKIDVKAGRGRPSDHGTGSPPDLANAILKAQGLPTGS